jgi:hypothetical protein
MGVSLCIRVNPATSLMAPRTWLRVTGLSGRAPATIVQVTSQSVISVVNNVNERAIKGHSHSFSWWYYWCYFLSLQCITNVSLILRWKIESSIVQSRFRHVILHRLDILLNIIQSYVSDLQVHFENKLTMPSGCHVGFCFKHDFF